MSTHDALRGPLLQIDAPHPVLLATNGQGCVLRHVVQYRLDVLDGFVDLRRRHVVNQVARFDEAIEGFTDASALMPVLPSFRLDALPLSAATDTAS